MCDDIGSAASSAWSAGTTAVSSGYDTLKSGATDVYNGAGYVVDKGYDLTTDAINGAISGVKWVGDQAGRHWQGLVDIAGTTLIIACAAATEGACAGLAEAAMNAYEYYQKAKAAYRLAKDLSSGKDSAAAFDVAGLAATHYLKVPEDLPHGSDRVGQVILRDVTGRTIEMFGEGYNDPEPTPVPHLSHGALVESSSRRIF